MFVSLFSSHTQLVSVTLRIMVNDIKLINIWKFSSEKNYFRALIKLYVMDYVNNISILHNPSLICFFEETNWLLE